MQHPSAHLLVRSVTRWWWVCVPLFFISCVLLKLNGSSIGRWQTVLGESAPIRGLLVSTPKKIRSDEWVVWTPSILSQARKTPRFPIENSDLGTGRTPLLMSVPVAYYTTFFRPQLWGFFFLDLERGFSWYWCSKVFGLLLAMAWLLRQIGIRSRGIVVFGSVSIFFSSFTQWWFSSPPMLPEMVASWGMCVGCMIACCEETSRSRLVLAAAGLVFFGVNFFLCLYPPFQLPLVFLGAVLLSGLWLERRKTDRPLRASRLLLGGGAAAVALLVLVPFWLDVWPTLQVLAATEYPAGRQNKGGGYALWQLLAGPLNFFESEDRWLPGFTNICEASNFYPLGLLALCGVAVGRVRHGIHVSPLVVALTLFIVALSVYCTVTLPPWLLRITLLSHIYEARALLGLGLAHILLAAIFLDRYQQPIFGKLWGSGSALLALVAFAALFYKVHQRAPAFFDDSRYLSLLIGINALIVAMFFVDRARPWLPVAFAGLLVCSNGLINPLMRGLGAITGSTAYSQIEQLHASDPNAKWIAYGDHLTAQLIKTTGASVLNGTKIVPDLDFYRALDPEGAYERVYNRYAWIVCIPKVFPDEVSFTLRHTDGFTINLPPGLKLLREAGYDYYAFGSQWPDAFFYDFVEVAKPPTESLWIYRRSPEGR